MYKIIWVFLMQVWMVFLTAINSFLNQMYPLVLSLLCIFTIAVSVSPVADPSPVAPSSVQLLVTYDFRKGCFHISAFFSRCNFTVWFLLFFKKSLFLKSIHVLYTFLSPSFLFCPHFKSNFRFVGGMVFSNEREMDSCMEWWWGERNACGAQWQNSVCCSRWIVIAHGIYSTASTQICCHTCLHFCLYMPQNSLF